jgi:hypothetical protein
MKKLIFTLCIIAIGYCSSVAQVKSIKLDKAGIEALLASAKYVQAQSKYTPAILDSIVKLYPVLQSVPKQDLNTLYTFLVPKLIPGITKNKSAFDLCEPYANLYAQKTVNAAPVIVSKYPSTTEKILMENLKIFYQLYLYNGLMHNNKLGILAEYQPEQTTPQNLDKLFIEARGSAADDVIYFTMAHSFVNLFTLIMKEYKIPNFNYSTN